MLTNENTLLLVIDFQERLMPSIHNNEELAKRAAILVSCIRLLDVPLLVTQQYTKGLGETITELKEALGDFEPAEKITFSCCGNDEFNDTMSRIGKPNIIVAGIEAHICVQQTVLDLLGGGYNVYVVSDCIGSRNDNNRLYAEQRMHTAGAVITTLESVIFELMVRADHPKRKDVTKLLK